MKSKKSSLPIARQLALTALTRCLKGQDIQAALDTTLGRHIHILPQDTALATELAYGTLRFKLRLDWLLNHFLKIPDRIPKAMHLALSVAAYEITQLSRVPAYASAHWCVDYIKKEINPSLAGVGNAVLRNIVNLGKDAIHEDFYAKDNPDPAIFLARYYASPLWLVRLWLKELKEEDTKMLLKASLTPPPLGLRIRPSFQKTTAYATLARSKNCITKTTFGLALKHAPENLHVLLDCGQAVRQSVAGQQILEELGASSWPRPLWDGCAGRGGKALLLADLHPGPVIATDPNARRIKNLNREILRLGIQNVLAARARADCPGPVNTRVEAILLDAPCSGLGVLSRRPDTKLRRTWGDIQSLAKLQEKILTHAANALVPGGILAYVTCTINHLENMGQTEHILAQNPSLTLTKTWQTPPHSPLKEFYFGALFTKNAKKSRPQKKAEPAFSSLNTARLSSGKPAKNHL